MAQPPNALLEAILRQALGGGGGGLGRAAGGGLGALGSLQPVTQDPLAALRQPRFDTVGKQPQGFAPGGPVLSFTGGSPFPVNDPVQQALSSLVLGTRVIEVLKASKQPKPPKKPAQGGA